MHKVEIQWRKYILRSIPLYLMVKKFLQSDTKCIKTQSFEIKIWSKFKELFPKQLRVWQR